VVIVGDLYLYLAVLSMLLIGRSARNDVLSVITAKQFLALEAVPVAAVLFRG